jgi:hypothetical protein
MDEVLKPPPMEELRQWLADAFGRWPGRPARTREHGIRLLEADVRQLAAKAGMPAEPARRNRRGSSTGRIRLRAGTQGLVRRVRKIDEQKPIGPRHEMQISAADFQGCCLRPTSRAAPMRGRARFRRHSRGSGTGARPPCSVTREIQLAPSETLGDLPGQPAEERIPPLVHASSDSRNRREGNVTGGRARERHFPHAHLGKTRLRAGA